MDLYTSIFEVIDMRSFSNLWYWISLAVLWSTASHFVLGVPFDLAMRAQKEGGQKMQDLEDLVRINIGRLLNIAEVSGLVLTALSATVLTILAVTAFAFDAELSQAVFLMAFPMSIVFLMNIRIAQYIRLGEIGGDALVRVLKSHRFRTQLIGIISIFVTSLWGMWQNIQSGPLGI